MEPVPLTDEELDAMGVQGGGDMATMMPLLLAILALFGNRSARTEIQQRRTRRQG